MNTHLSPAEQFAFFLDLPPQSIAASSSANGSGIDMLFDGKQWDGVLFILAVGVIDGTQDMKAQSDDNSGFSSPTDITAAAITQMAGTDDNKIAILDVYRPPERFVRSVVTNGAGAAADFQGVIGMLYRGTGRFPITQHSTVKELKKVVAG